jgi:hypothetical protein
MRGLGSGIGFGLIAISLLGGCAHVREARALHPNPIESFQSPDMLPVSAKLFIYQRDKNFDTVESTSDRNVNASELLSRSYQLRSSAQFSVVNRDRLRFHVTIARWFEDEADTANWKAWLLDETGHRYEVTNRETPRVNRISVGWAPYPPDPRDSWCREPPCKSRITPPFNVYEGVVDLMFLSPNIISKDRRSLTLVLTSDTGLEYRYAWTFGEGWKIEHYGRTHVDDEMGVMPVPGPDTEVAGTRYAGEKW